MIRQVATWNVNSLRVRLPHLAEWLAANPVDVMALQETKLPDADFPAADLQALGWNSACSGQRTYNGVAILSRNPATDVVAGIPGFDDEQRRVLAVSLGSLRVIDVYVPNGQTVGSDKFAYKLRWLDALREYVAAELRRHPHLVVLGDFNVAPEDRDVHDPSAWEGSVHVSPPERAALQALLGAGLTDCFRLFEQPEKSFSWWDYRMMAFRRNAGLRIDLILASSALAQKCGACHIDKAPRKLERPSDHTPVVASFDI
ncbi:MAG: exodeoxyribonuclease III [Steroidobacteraceae bacterium]|nr:exodeoxyribonuclease III [Steroidobacteraceae bacterium]MBP7013886.1 exodeoxyribonuclease III [Steroidobacteraceae bacterium]